MSQKTATARCLHSSWSNVHYHWPGELVQNFYTAVF